jgi:hypothetical protein
VKKLVLFRRDIYKGHIDPTEEPQRTVKYMYGYMTEGTKRATYMDKMTGGTKRATFMEELD